MIIITNNEKTRENFASLTSVEWVSGTAFEVLFQARKLVEQGYHLVSCPLGANNRLNRCRYRSIILGKKQSWQGDDRKMLDNAMAHMDRQGLAPWGDSLADQDYQWIDAELVKTAWEEALEQHCF